VAYVIIADHRARSSVHSDVSLSGKALVRPAHLAPLGDTLMVQTYTDADLERLIDSPVPLVFSGSAWAPSTSASVRSRSMRRWRGSATGRS